MKNPIDFHHSYTCYLRCTYSASKKTPNKWYNSKWMHSSENQTTLNTHTHSHKTFIFAIQLQSKSYPKRLYTCTTRENALKYFLRCRTEMYRDYISEELWDVHRSLRLGSTKIELLIFFTKIFIHQKNYVRFHMSIDKFCAHQFGLTFEWTNFTEHCLKKRNETRQTHIMRWRTFFV